MVGNCTQGDWRFEKKDKELYIFSDGGTPQFPYFATVAVMNNWDKEECEANVHLLAASKDLYSELVGADDTICALCKRLNPQREGCTSCQDREARLKAIRKAAGTDKFTGG